MSVGATAICLVLGFTGCSKGAKSEADIKKNLSATLQSDGGGALDAKAADCYAQVIIDEVGVEKLRDVDLSAKDPSAALADDIAKAAIRAGIDCQLSGAPG
jgi:hypothetical protein